MGSQERPAGGSSDRVAMPAHGGNLRSAGRERARVSDHRNDWFGDRRVFFREQGAFSEREFEGILEHVPDARRKAQDGELLFGTVDTWPVWKLTNGAVHVTDYSSASRTMLMDLDTGEWDAGLLQVFGVPPADVETTT